MLRKLSIRNLRSIVDADLEFGRLNLFIGPNGSGKTNVLEAIGLVSAMLGRGPTIRELTQRGVRVLAPTELLTHFGPRSVLNLRADLDTSVYQFEAGGGSLDQEAGDEPFLSALSVTTERLTENNDFTQFWRIGDTKGTDLDDKVVQEFMSRITIEGDRSFYDVLKPILSLSPEAGHNLDLLSKYAIYSPQSVVLYGNVADDRSNGGPLGLTGANLARALFEIRKSDLTPLEMGNKWRIIRNAELPGIFEMIGWATDAIAIDSLKFILVGDRYCRTSFHSGQVSEGALYLLFVGALLNHPQSPKVFALDNVDGTLNPGTVRQLIAHIRKAVEADPERQIFMTSHNPTALDGFDIFNADHKVFVVYRDDVTGHTRFHSLVPRDGMTRDDWEREGGYRNLSAMWVDGLIPHALQESRIRRPDTEDDE